MIILVLDHDVLMILCVSMVNSKSKLRKSKYVGLCLVREIDES